MLRLSLTIVINKDNRSKIEDIDVKRGTRTREYTQIYRYLINLGNLRQNKS